MCEVVQCDPSVELISDAAAAALAPNDPVGANARQHCVREPIDVSTGVWILDQPCTDGNACTLVDGCRGQTTCQGGEQKRCDAAPACQFLDGCNPTNGECVYGNLPIGTPCNDGDVCTLNDVCDGQGTCSGTERNCNQEIGLAECGTTTYYCEPIGGPTGTCLQTELTGVVGTPCDDGNPCTVQDVCTAPLTCSGTGAVCTPAPPTPGIDPQCQDTAGTCTGVTGTGFPICVYPFLAAGTGCFSGALDGCTIGDTCNGAGVCIAGPPNPCNAPPVCHSGGASVCSGGSCRYRALPTVQPAFTCTCDPSAGDAFCACGTAPSTSCNGECENGFCVAVCIPACPSGFECTSTSPRVCTAIPPAECELEQPLECLNDLCGITEADGISFPSIAYLEACIVSGVDSPLALGALVLLGAILLILAIACCQFLPLCLRTTFLCCFTLATRQPAERVQWHRVQTEPRKSTLVATSKPIRRSDVEKAQRKAARRGRSALGGSGNVAKID